MRCISSSIPTIPTSSGGGAGAQLRPQQDRGLYRTTDGGKTDAFSSVDANTVLLMSPSSDGFEDAVRRDVAPGCTRGAEKVAEPEVVSTCRSTAGELTKLQGNGLPTTRSERPASRSRAPIRVACMR
jgi:hypothetical protein